MRPLQNDWESLSEAQKRKWLVVTHNYANMDPDYQLRLQVRMREWATMTPQQRNVARLNFGEAKQLDRERRIATWDAYQKLQPEERRRLAAAAAKPSGAALALKPVPAQKIARVPSKDGSKVAPRTTRPASAIQQAASASAAAPASSGASAASTGN